MHGQSVAMHPEESNGGDYVYAGETTPAESGLHGFTIRVRPSHPDLWTSFVPGLIAWADGRTTATAR
jgi:hypothetical protein